MGGRLEGEIGSTRSDIFTLLKNLCGQFRKDLLAASRHEPVLRVQKARPLWRDHHDLSSVIAGEAQEAMLIPRYADHQEDFSFADPVPSLSRSHEVARLLQVHPLASRS